MALTAIINLFLILLFPLAGAPAANYSGGAILSLQAGTAPAVVTAARTAVLAGGRHFFLAGQEADTVQPIASITKLMTALVFLENNPGWENEYQITEADHIAGGRLNLFRGERVKLRDLFYTSLVASDNGATVALARATGLSEEAFVLKMNRKAKQLGLVKTNFSDPSGLSDRNISTAREVAWLAAAALGRTEIREATARAEYRFQTLGGREKLVESTDYLLFSETPAGLQILGGKTGYTDKAGYCFVGLWRGADGREVITVALDSADRNERFRDSRALANWALSGYNWNK